MRYFCYLFIELGVETCQTRISFNQIVALMLVRIEVVFDGFAGLGADSIQIQIGSNDPDFIVFLSRIVLVSRNGL